MRNVDDEHFEPVELCFIDMKLCKPRLVLWHCCRSDPQKVRLLVAKSFDGDESETVVEFPFRGGSLERGPTLVPKTEGLSVTKWCADGDHVALFDWHSRQIQYYSLA